MCARMKGRPLLVATLAAMGTAALVVSWGGLSAANAAVNDAVTGVGNVVVQGAGAGAQAKAGAQAVVRDVKGTQLAVVTFRDAGNGKVSVRAAAQNMPEAF